MKEKCKSEPHPEDTLHTQGTAVVKNSSVSPAGDSSVAFALAKQNQVNAINFSNPTS
jgi:hypothetical protein